ncbi:MAG TPA: hypothetical protein ENN25_02400 [Euryarchaeota archaeon]|nr:hypothetical protein [Euryarchaeota archaeon]
MKTVQLGCGITGLVCAEHLVKNDKIDELILADYNTDTAQALKQRLKNDKISVVKVDAADRAAVKKLISGKDLVISSIPGYLNRLVLEVSIETGTDYLDYSLPIGADWNEFDELIDYCKGAENKIITSMGADPGISDVFARRGADLLDSVETIRTMDGDSASAEGFEFFGLWSPRELLEEVTVPASVFRDGKIEFVPPLDERQLYKFPDPIGDLPVYNTDHEETHLMSRYIKGVKNVDFRIAIDDDFARIAKTLKMLGLHRTDPVNVKGKQVVPLDVVVALMPRPVDMIGKVKGFAAVVVESTGIKDGKKKMVRIYAKMSHEEAYKIAHSNATGYMVGTGGAVGAEMLLAGEIKQNGLIVPEMLDAEKYIERLSKKNVDVKIESIDI